MLEFPTRHEAKRFGLRYLQYFPRQNVFHPGVDYNYGVGDQDKGQEVLSPTWGVVEYVSERGTNGGLGNYIVIRHPHNGPAWTRYLHLDSTEVLQGQTVAPGQLIGRLGDSGTDNAHLHFEVLTQKGIDWIKGHYRPYGKYPIGVKKKTVSELWMDPMEWIETQNHHVGSEKPLSPTAAKRKAGRLKEPKRSRLLKRLSTH